MAVRNHHPASYEAIGDMHHFKGPKGSSLCLQCRTGLALYNAKLKLS
jgi:hypothetical protein